MSISLSKHSIPSQPRCSPGFTRIRCSRLASALKTISFTSVDFPEPDTPVTQTSFPTGNSTSIPFRLCIEAPGAHKVLAGDRLGVPLDLAGRPFGDHVAAVLTCSRAHVDEPVGRPHHLLVVLDHEHGVAEVAEPL